MVAARNIMSIEEGRTIYRTSQGEEREAFAKLYLSLLHRLHKSTVAEWEIAGHILEVTRFDGLPKRISIRQFMNVCGLANRAVQIGLARLKSRGMLYEEREPDSQHIRYALVDSGNPGSTGFAPFEQADGSLAVILLGSIVYPVPEGVLFFSTVDSLAKCIKKEYGTVLKRGTHCTKKEYSTVSKNDTVPSRQPAQQQAPQAPRESLESIPENKGESAPANLSDSQTTAGNESQGQRLSEKRSRKKAKLLPPALFPDTEAQALQTEARDLLTALRHIRTWQEEEGEALEWLETLLRIRKYPLPFLLDEACGYKGFKPATGKHTWRGFEGFCRNKYGKIHLEEYRQREAEQQRKQQAASQPRIIKSEQEREAELAARMEEQKRSQARTYRWQEGAHTDGR